MQPRHARSAALAAFSLSLLLAGCSSSTSTEAEAGPSASASGSREAGVVTMPVKLCLENGTTADLEFAPTGPYGEFATAKPGQSACFMGSTSAGDPVASITFADDSVLYAYGRNPVFGRPDIRVCADQDCNSSLVQYDLSEGVSKTSGVQGHTFTALRNNDADGYKQLFLRVG